MNDARAREPMATEDSSISYRHYGKKHSDFLVMLDTVGICVAMNVDGENIT